jgi:pimeloyl-ACP methyl ester carboxylesterase
VGRRLVLVHGATSGPWAFDGWMPALGGFDVRVPDLQNGLDVGRATMEAYWDQVEAHLDPLHAADGAHKHGGAASSAVVCGWSMGGLVAMMAARRRRLAALVVVEPSLPLEVGGGDPDLPLIEGTYEAADAYGPVADATRHRPESVLARGQRLRGISIPTIDCPMLVVAGRSYLATRGEPVAARYAADLRVFPRLGHGELVERPEVAAAVTSWIGEAVGG